MDLCKFRQNPLDRRRSAFLLESEYDCHMSDFKYALICIGCQDIVQTLDLCTNPRVRFSLRGFGIRQLQFYAL